ncbi:phosphodiester glycosidase family protein [Gorillibacterium sp. sgz5001074]|uniref:phosphodiester glycosidase family protein n=1 Tax=Gorillibacterium sp. sgz5001074 TaxID=3446695 RepID=UPI003F6703AB
MFRTKKSKIIAVSVSGFLLTVGGVLYGLADRYLIEHVEVVLPPQSAITAQAGTAGAGIATTAGTTGASAANNASGTSAGAPSVLDDWNYVSADKEIHIKKVETGTGADKVTYYTADVKLTNAASLLSAFAKNQFGRNITENTSKIAADNQALFAINGDYYGFRSDGVIIRNGTLFRDSPARIGLGIYKDGTMKAYDETLVKSSSLLSAGVLQTLSFGPALVQNGKAVTNFDNVKIDTNFGNRTIEENNPRTGIGVIAPNHFLFIVVDGRSTNYSQGLSLSAFAKLFADLGATEAYNLDGGGSSTMYFNGRVVNNPLGKGNERGVSDILYLTK